MDIHVTHTGDREVGIRFEEFPDNLYADLKAEIEGLTAELLGLVVAATPSRTGRLRGEERMVIHADPTHIKGEVTVAGDAKDLAKAGALEYGAHRPSRVSAHAMRLDHAWGQAFSAPEMVMVAAFTRTPDIEAFAYESGPLGAMQPEIIAGLNAAIERSVAKANG
jgi:hypothetical protein